MSANTIKLAVMLLCVGGVLASGQDVSETTPSRTPGVWHDGKFVGFVPAHLKNQAKQNRANAAQAQEPTPARRPPSLRSCGACHLAWFAGGLCVRCPYWRLHS